jgi:hypothetical protein
MKSIAIVCGDRYYLWSDRDSELLRSLLGFLGVTDVWHGGASGVDLSAACVADEMGLRVRTFHPHPELFGGVHARALVERNQEMAQRGYEEVRDGSEVAVIAWPGGEGTANMMAAAVRNRLRIVDLRGGVR